MRLIGNLDLGVGLRLVLRPELLCVLVLLVLGADVQALVLAGEDASRHDRYLATGEPNPDFFAADLDLSGVSIGGNAVMISPQHFLYSTHVGHGSTLQLMNRAGVVMSYAVAGDFSTNADGVIMGEPVGVSGSTSDLSLGVLVEPIRVDDQISFYEVIDAPQQWYTGREVIVFGKEGQAGRNRIDGVTLVCTGDESLCANHDETVVGHYDFDAVGGLGIDEAGGEGGDSGKPSLLVIEDRVTVMGVHFAIGTTGGSSLVSTFDSFVPFYADQLDAHMADAGLSVTRITIPDVPLGDVTQDGLLDIADVDLLGIAMDSGTRDPIFELNGDGLINADDGAYWVQSIVGTLPGDYNLDGKVDVQDLSVWAAGFDSGDRYSQGDADFNGQVDVGDLSLWATHFGQVSHPDTLPTIIAPADALAIPEPTTFVFLAGLGTLALLKRRPRHIPPTQKTLS